VDTVTGVLRRAVMRDHSVHERPSTPLELLFDLCFVVAVAFLAAELHHGIAAGHPLAAITAYALLFIPIWWAWMSYTWFATAFSHDDPLTRVLTFAQMGGVLALAAAIPSASRGELVPFAIAYAVMRLPLVLAWLRSAYADPPHRAFALTYAVGSVVAQALWVIGAVAGGVLGTMIFVIALAVELATPVLAVRRSPDRVFHPGHIAERYGLFTIIVLGETILAVSTGLVEVVEGGLVAADALGVVVAALVIAAALWWAYFGALSTEALVRNRAAAFLWGYGHYAVFAAIAAVGAGVRAQVDVVAGDGHGVGASGTVVVALASAVALLALAAMVRAAESGRSVWHLVGPAGALVVAAAAVPLIGPVAGCALIALLVCTSAAGGGRRPDRG
jgi:low temperature requirement protein LtrA